MVLGTLQKRFSRTPAHCSQCSHSSMADDPWRKEMKAELGEVRKDMKLDLNDVKKEMKAEISEVNSNMSNNMDRIFNSISLMVSAFEAQGILPASVARSVRSFSSVHNIESPLADRTSQHASQRATEPAFEEPPAEEKDDNDQDGEDDDDQDGEEEDDQDGEEEEDYEDAQAAEDANEDGDDN